VKFQGVDEDHYVWSLSASEKRALIMIVEEFPMLDGSLRPLSSDATPEAAEHNQLLIEALAERRQQMRQDARAILSAEGTFQKQGPKLKLRLKRSEADCLLQIANDVRVGCWTRLGSPDPASVPWWELIGDNAKFGFLLDACGVLQMQLIHALRRAP